MDWEEREKETTGKWGALLAMAIATALAFVSIYALSVAVNIPGVGGWALCLVSMLSTLSYAKVAVKAEQGLCGSKSPNLKPNT